MKLACLVCTLLTVAGFAQTDRGTITGTVSDPAGAVVPGAIVVATNKETGSVLLITTEALVAELPKEEKAAPMPAMDF